MNRWPSDKPKTTLRLILEYHRVTNPVTKAVIRQILMNRYYRLKKREYNAKTIYEIV